MYYLKLNFQVGTLKCNTETRIIITCHTSCKIAKKVTDVFSPSSISIA